MYRNNLDKLIIAPKYVNMKITLLREDIDLLRERLVEDGSDIVISDLLVEI